MSPITETDLKDLFTQITNGFREVNTQFITIGDRYI
jgi:hypothetical protein